MKQIHQNFIKVVGNIETDFQTNNHHIKIAQQNIYDLNKRFYNFNQVVYVVDKSKFEPSDYTDEANYIVVDLLNKYISWSKMEGKERAYQIQTFLRSVQNKFEELNTDMHYRKLTNGLSEEDIVELKKFLNNYRSFSPYGVLSDDERVQMTSKINKYCKELETNYLIDDNEELELNFETSDLVKKYNKKLEKPNSTINQIFNKYFRFKNKEASVWTRLIGQ